jgi:hypothetical protein
VSVVLDAGDLRFRDRTGAVSAVFAHATFPVKVSFVQSSSPTVARIDRWTVGEATMLRLHAENLIVERSAETAPSDPSQMVAVGFLFGRAGRWQIDRRLALADQVNVADLARPYALSWAGTGGAFALKVSCAQLALSPAVIPRVSPRLAESPLYGVVSDHIRRLASHTDEVASAPGGSE